MSERKPESAGPERVAGRRASVVSKSAEPAAPRRRPGRPSGTARGPLQREKLLDVALGLFARQGIVETTLGEIAREAGVTSAMMHYYFHTREQLIDVLIDERFIPLRETIRGAFEHLDDPVAAITDLVERLVKVSEDHPWFAPLWIREVVSEGGILRQRMNDRYGDADQNAALARIVRWQREGLLNAHLEPSLIIESAVGLTMLPLATSGLWNTTAARRSLSAREIGRHVIALLTHGISSSR
ncbi:TetR/AcrR family transcriptional regulator [Trinickia dinghuensis]|uniref:TetR/AcrR family transcriptional regulator n=1 Tax=Trinickia dinghuensis TaxID=2291023 RepID=A0A3D8K212_9BURK|nr:TetR/AcrR family transcriptional regulator [Trinickia dinghuensis]RDU99507.1 TetR/AcrR family transcriptional regulator [Trinickia dinghuensis]